MNNKLKVISRSFIFLSLLIGSSTIVLIPVNAIDNNDVENNKMAIKTEIISPDMINSYIENTKNKIRNNDMVKAQTNINTLLDYVKKMSININNQKIVNDNCNLEDKINEIQTAFFIKKAEESLKSEKIIQAEENLNKALDYANDINNISIKKSKLSDVNIITDKINEYQSNKFLKKVVSSIGNNNFDEIEDDLITAFKYGNKISDSKIRQPIVEIIIKIQNQVSISNKYLKRDV